MNTLTGRRLSQWFGFVPPALAPPPRAPKEPRPPVEWEVLVPAGSRVGKRVTMIAVAARAASAARAAAKRELGLAGRLPAGTRVRAAR